MIDNKNIELSFIKMSLKITFWNNFTSMIWWHYGTARPVAVTMRTRHKLIYYYVTRSQWFHELAISRPKTRRVLWFFLGINGLHALSCHYGDVTIGTIVSQITSLTIVYLTVYSDADQRKHQSSASLPGKSPGTGECPTQMASNAENVSIWWRHHAILCLHEWPGLR